MNGPGRKTEHLPKRESANWRKKIGKIYKSNTFLLVVSIFGAVFLWSVLVASDGTLTREKTFASVEVGIVGSDTLKSNGYIIVDDLESVLPTVKLTVEVSQDNYNRVTGANFSPRIDISKIRTSGEQEVEITFASTSYGRVVECEPASITVNVERYITSSRVPVVLETVGAVPSGLWADTPRLDPTYLSVSGPQSMIQSLYRATVTFDLSLINDQAFTQRGAAPFALIDREGNVLNSSLLRTTYQSILVDTVTVEMDVYKQKEVPLNAENVCTGAVPIGYSITGVTLQPASVCIAAKDEVLAQVEEMMLEGTLDVTDATQTQSANIKIKKRTDVQNMNIAEVQVQVDIEELQMERTFRRVPIEVEGTSAGTAAKLATAYAQVTIVGPYTFVDTLTQEEIFLRVDVANLAPGEYTLPVQCHIDNAPSYKALLPENMVTVTIAP